VSNTFEFIALDKAIVVHVFNITIVVHVFNTKTENCGDLY